MATQVLYAEPYPLEVVLSRTALLLIDFQNDFCSPGGWADLAGLDACGAPLVNLNAADVLLLNPHTQTLEFASGRGFRSSTLARGIFPICQIARPASSAR